MKHKQKSFSSKPGTPKRLRYKKWSFRNRNFFYRAFDNIASQLAVINKGLKDSGPKRVWEFK